MTEIEQTIYEVGVHQLAVLQAGPVDGPPVLLLHGIPARARLWEQVMPPLAKAGYRVFAPDLPGYGDTEIDPSELKKPKLDQAYSLKGAGDLIAAWWRAEGHAQAKLVGHDIGGGVAQIFACEHGDLVERLIISNSIVEDRWPVAAFSLIKSIAGLGLYPFAARTGGMKNPYTSHILRGSVADRSKMTKQEADHIFWHDKVSTARGRTAFGHHLSALSPKQLKSYGSKLRDIAAPVKLVWGMADRNQAWNPIGRRISVLIPHAEVQPFESVGHFFQLEKPDVYAEYLDAWFRSETVRRSIP